ncbi:MAG TPA: hypothetical protein IGS40_09215 [Trichormus sp. M33_DOE_039]|nr:hypothetical protein [Trichormus sp. M33_DOE_039]
MRETRKCEDKSYFRESRSYFREDRSYFREDRSYFRESRSYTISSIEFDFAMPAAGVAIAQLYEGVVFAAAEE